MSLTSLTVPLNGRMPSWPSNASAGGETARTGASRRAHRLRGLRRPRAPARARGGRRASEGLPRAPPHRGGRGGASSPGLQGGRSGRRGLLSGRGIRRFTIGQGRKARDPAESGWSHSSPRAPLKRGQKGRHCLSMSV